MSLYKDASLVMIPSAYKDGKLYSIRPTDGSGDFTFSRGSNLAATRVDVNGLIEKGRENDILYSQDFSNAVWIKSNVSVTGGQTDPNSGSTAALFQTTATSNVYVYQINSGGSTLSVYAKAGTRSSFVILNGAFNNGASFDLSTETTSTLGAGVISKIEDVGNDWYRCSVYVTSKSNFLFGLTDISGGGAVVGDNLTFAFPQSEPNSIVATDYIETGASTAQAGILEDMPRLDYSGGASCPSLLLEPQRSNLYPHSEYFEGWTKNNAVTTTNASTGPEGLRNATKLAGSAANSEHTLYYVYLGTNTTYSHSAFYKAGEYSYAYMRAGGNTNDPYVIYDLTDQSVIGSAACTHDIESVGNDWYRIIMTPNSASGVQATNLMFLPSSGYTLDSLNIPSFTGDGTSGGYIYGAQLESGSYPTSYIPTYGTSQTRSKEGAQVTSVSDLIGQTQGTLFAEVDSFGVGEVANRILGVSNGTGAERIIMLTRSYGFRFIMTNSSSNNVDYTYSINTDGVHKIAMTYDANEVRIFVDGVKATTDSSVILPSPLNSIHIGKQEVDGNYSNNFGGSAKQSLVFTTALTDSECIALTTL